MFEQGESMIFERNAEVQNLENCFNRTENEIVVLYGCSGIGKADLLQRFCKNKAGFYYHAIPCSEKEQIKLLNRELKDYLPENVVVLDSFFSIFSAVISLNTDKKVLIIYEFQHIVRNCSNFMNDLIKVIHNQHSQSSVLVILCSSSPYWIEKIMLDKLGNSAYEIFGFIKVEPLNFLNLVGRFKRYNFEECINTYAILGGIPLLWSHWNQELSVKENICEQILSPGSYLYEKGMHLLTGELREPAVYNTILLNLAAGRQKLNDLYMQTGFGRSKIAVYLKNLIDLGLVEKIDSCETSGKANALKGTYRISDSFTCFWYRYVYARISKLDMIGADKFYRKYIESTLKLFVADTFKKVCREYLMLLNQMNRLNRTYSRFDSWNGKDGSLDIVAQNDNCETLIGCCSWEKKTFLYSDFEKMLLNEKKAGLKADDYYLFTSGTFDELLKKEAACRENLHLIDQIHISSNMAVIR